MGFMDAVAVEGLWKEYRYGALSHETLRKDLQSWWARVRGIADPNGPVDEPSLTNRMVVAAAQSRFWALRDVSFTVGQGEVLGVIGRNGAGKSTLLKIMSRVTTPSRGTVKVRGRVASLLEVGTGFHPELTGRENTYLNGAILGMRRAEVRDKFDEIVAFAEIEKFIDTPVKRYSSGMYVRLAFAVAAHLEPEILLVDEVLAVGDTDFQSKCLGKMQEVAKAHGRTVLFTSHNMAAINRLCTSAILLEGGRLAKYGPVHEVTAAYLSREMAAAGERHWDETTAPGDDVARLLCVRVLQDGVPTATVDVRRAFVVESDYQCRKNGAQLLCAVSFFDDLGNHLFVTADFGDRQWAGARSRGRYTSRCTIPGNLLAEGQLRIAVEVATRGPNYRIHFLVLDAATIQVVDSGQPGSVREGWGREIPGLMRPLCRWTTIAVE